MRRSTRESLNTCSDWMNDMKQEVGGERKGWTREQGTNEHDNRQPEWLLVEKMYVSCFGRTVDLWLPRIVDWRFLLCCTSTDINMLYDTHHTNIFNVSTHGPNFHVQTNQADQMVSLWMMRTSWYDQIKSVYSCSKCEKSAIIRRREISFK